MATSEQFMLRCIELAQLGKGNVSPNPMVGCVVVHNGKIIGEGWHQKIGTNHAEVNAIHQVIDKTLLPQSTVYVNLEPCSHFGKTPPCADLLIQYKVKKVVIGMIDPFSEVAGKGIEKLKNAGIDVEVGVLEKECIQLNRRFIIFHQYKRPYILLKWAQTIDGFISPDATILSATDFEKKRHITGYEVQALVHKWRGEEDAILVGTRTILSDNPSLNTRAYQGKNPVRITIDKENILPKHFKIFDGTQRTIIFTYKEVVPPTENLTYVTIDKQKPIWGQLLLELYSRNIQSIIVEGGAFTLNELIKDGLWDEAQLFTAPIKLGSGVVAPAISGKITLQTRIADKQLLIYHNV